MAAFRKESPWGAFGRFAPRDDDDFYAHYNTGDNWNPRAKCGAKLTYTYAAGALAGGATGTAE